MTQPPPYRVGLGAKCAGPGSRCCPTGPARTLAAAWSISKRGATTGWHTHKSDQILVVTAGVGIVANEHEQQEIAVGDVVHVLMGENHWHGAKAESYMSHITITAVE